jgi:hypothetical protein
MESAPKDGTRIVLWRSRRGVAIGQYAADKYAIRPRPYWTTDQERLWGVKETREDQPTHWMPLPDPPAALALTAGETDV